MSESVLDQELYVVAEAARLLGIHPTTLRHWLDGYERKGVGYDPVLRPEPTGSDFVTWGEFVEAGLLAEYRRRRDVPLQHIRPVVEGLRRESGLAYPLAYFRPYVADRELVVELQDEGAVPKSVRLVVYRKKQLVLADPAETFFMDKVDWAGGDVARRYRPEGKASPVIIDPKRNFGIPEVEGIRTEILYELFQAGEPLAQIATGYELPSELVEAAIRFEAPRPKAPEPEPAPQAA